MKDKISIKSFLWQHFLLLIALYIMTLGVVVCVRSMLGSSVISVLPYVFEYSGKQLPSIPALTIGEYTYIMNAILVLGQIIILRKQFEKVQLFQLLIGFVFGLLIDVNMLITQWLMPEQLYQKAITQIIGCTILSFGIATEVRCGSITMPGEGFPVAISKVCGIEFAKAKIIVDTSLVVLGIVCCYCFLGAWQWHIVGVGTLFAMFYIGLMVKFFSRRLQWFDKILQSIPNFQRGIYGLARFIKRQS